MSARIATNDAMPFPSLTSVGTYRSRLTQKLEIGGFAGLVKFAIASGWSAS